MATDLGKVGIVMKGTWSSSATYEILDAVSYNGGLYIAKQAVPANTLPTNTTYWQAGVDPSTMGNYYLPIIDKLIAGNIPTVEELNSITFPAGVYVVRFATSSSPTTYRSSMVVCMSSSTYGAGMLFSNYNVGGDSYFKVRYISGSWAMTPF